MTELRPLVEASASSATRELLRAGRSDAPGREFSERLLIGLGVGAAATTVSALASAGTAAAALQGAASTGGGTASLTVLAAKWVAVGVVGGGILAGGAEVAFSPPSAEPVTEAVASAAPARPARAPKPGPLPQSQPSAALVTPLEAEPPPSPTNEPDQPKAPTAPASAAPLEGGKLGYEVEAIDRARRAMAAGKLQQALRELDAFDRIEGTGVLAREAKVLRIEALYRLGEDALARQLAEQYRTAYPNDSHLTRLRAFEQPKR